MSKTHENIKVDWFFFDYTADTGFCFEHELGYRG